MTPIDQIVFEDGKGDCLRACVASITHIPLLDIPNFADDNSYVFGAIAFLQQRGYRTLRIDLAAGPVRKEYISCPEYCVVMGASPRATPEKRKGHAVVGRANGWSFRIDHDPHPSRAGLDGDPEAALFIFGDAA
jgi:hypothetical protein